METAERRRKHVAKSTEVHTVAKEPTIHLQPERIYQTEFPVSLSFSLTDESSSRFIGMKWYMKRKWDQGQVKY